MIYSAARSIAYAWKIYRGSDEWSIAFRYSPYYSDIKRVYYRIIHTSVHHIYFSASGKWELLTNIYALQIGSHETGASYSSGRIIYWKLGNFWVAVNDGSEMLFVCFAARKWRFSSALFLVLFASKEPLDSSVVSIIDGTLDLFLFSFSSLSFAYHGLASTTRISTFTIDELILRFRQFPKRFIGIAGWWTRSRKTSFRVATRNVKMIQFSI